MNRFLYRGRKTSQISFPLGGIGSGCIGLAGNGRLIDWEIFNRPNKSGLNGFTHFAIKAERDGQVLDARVVNGDLPPPYSGGGNGTYNGFGFGPDRATLAGLPHFRDHSFRGEYPLAQLEFAEPAFPGRVQLRAFNPLIPLNDADSSLPAAFFELTVANPTAAALDYTIACTVKNPHKEKSTNALLPGGGFGILHLGNDSLAPDSVDFGSLAFGTDAASVSHQEYWFRGAWFDNLGVWWRDFTAPGALHNRSYPAASGKGQDHATLAARISVAPGASGSVRFVLAWHYPNATNYWNPEKTAACGDGCSCAPSKPVVWKNYYATLFPDAPAVVRYALQHWSRLAAGTLRFQEALFGSTLPEPVLDAISANISILKTPTVLRLEDGSFYGWEGCHCSAGCCEGTCQHVWNYAYALPFLFPRLERSIRDLEYRYNLREDGGMTFRLQLPLGRTRSQFRPCADGQFGTVMKVYRDWKISGDSAWLQRLWPAVKKSVEFAWAPSNEDRWDRDRSGVLHGRQHHTLDMELFGPNSWLSGFYLGALKAAAEMADACADPAAAAEYRRLFEQGRTWVDRHLFNGEYYVQQLDLDDRSQLDAYAQTAGAMTGGDVYAAYWDAEHAELKYQLGEGSSIDQVLAQWHANLMGLGQLFDAEQTRSALRAIYRYNFQPSMRDFANFCRLYCLNDEAGTLIAAWPPGKRKPVVPAPYAEETMHGFEYQVACHMIQEGMLAEGLRLVKAVRDRYDGERRNPWNEFECGSNYARSMASYALLHAYSGFSYDLNRGAVGFQPVRVPKGGFRCFWSLDSGWGNVSLAKGRAELQLAAGRLSLQRLTLPFVPRRLESQGRELAFHVEGRTAVLAAPCELGAGQSLCASR